MIPTEQAAEIELHKKKAVDDRLLLYSHTHSTGNTRRLVKNDCFS
ncbi:hypothetical protein B4113_1891 [Geobacillus sp. B4113_201601]|nr:hypothetical protein B4113_1891 [Geobacillus sp. B4113_201601]